MGHNVSDSRMGWTGFAILLCCGFAAHAIKPPEKVDQINCSIFEALPILEEVRPFLDDAQAPGEADFKTRLAYVDDWTKRRAMAAVKLDKLITVCHAKLLEHKESGD